MWAGVLCQHESWLNFRGNAIRFAETSRAEPRRHEPRRAAQDDGNPHNSFESRRRFNLFPKRARQQPRFIARNVRDIYYGGP